jgi:4-carboxymuconolactone decarboxylase
MRPQPVEHVLLISRFSSKREALGRHKSPAERFMIMTQARESRTHDSYFGIAGLGMLAPVVGAVFIGFLVISMAMAVLPSRVSQGLGSTVHGKKVDSMTSAQRIHRADIQAVAPALDHYTRDRLLGEVWRRPGLSVRDRGLITVAALIARNQSIEMPFYFNLALDDELKPSELSETITHLAFYTGWPNAVAAVAAAEDVFAARKISADQLPAVTPQLLPLDEAAETDRATRVNQQFGATFPGVVQYTRDLLFRDLWLRPGLAPRDRSLVTVSALVATGQVAQIPYHLNRAMDNGLTQQQAAEVLTHLAFYTGWPNVFSAMPVAKDVFEKRRHSAQ